MPSPTVPARRDATDATVRIIAGAADLRYGRVSGLDAGLGIHMEGTRL